MRAENSSDGPLESQRDDNQVRSWIARALLVAGRILLVLGPAIVIACRLTRPMWASAPPDAGGVAAHWIPQSTLAASFVFALALPALLLPVGSSALAVVDKSLLTVQTVLGTRRLVLGAVQTRRLTIPGRGHELSVAVLRGHRRHRVIVTASEWWLDQHEFGTAVDALNGDITNKTQSASRRSRTFDLLAGWFVVLGWGIVAFLVLAILFAIAIGS